MEVMTALTAALVGAVIGGAFTLLGAERGVRGALLVSTTERDAAFWVAVRAAESELQVDARVLSVTAGLHIWSPLSQTALDRLIGASGFDHAIAEDVLHAAAVLSEYNALIDVRKQFIQSDQPASALLDRRLNEIVGQALGVIETAAASMQNSRYWAAPSA